MSESFGPGAHAAMSTEKFGRNVVGYSICVMQPLISDGTSSSDFRFRVFSVGFGVRYRAGVRRLLL